MTFAAPAMLWSLLALAPLVAVYFLKVRPTRRPTTAYFLWEKIFTERRSNRLWRRLRSLWSLVIMALAFAAIALALAEPRWSDATRPDLLILVDNSASMQTQESGGTRLELAKEKARSLARALDGVQRAAVATVADRLRYQSHLTDNPRELIAAIDRIEPTYETFRMGALPTGEPGGEPSGDNEKTTKETKDTKDERQDSPLRRRMLLVTDGVLADEELPEEVELIVVGEEQSNVGLVAVDLQFIPGAADRMSLYFQVASSWDEAVEVDLLLSRVDDGGDDGGDERLAKVIPLTVAPGVNQPQTISVDGAEPGRWIAQLDGDALADDALAADNRAHVVARRPPPIAMAVESDDRFFFEQSVQAFSAGSAALRLVENSGDAEVVLAKGAAVADHAIIFQPRGKSPWWEGAVGEGADDEIEVGAVKVLIDDHPLVAHLDPLSISFLGARQLTPPAGSQVLLESAEGAPLLYTASRAGKSAVVVNLDPVAAEFYFSAWFPVLVHASAKHLAGRDEPLLAVYEPGAAVALPADEGEYSGEFSGEMQSPAGATSQLVAPRIGRLGATGFYEVTGGDERWTIACSLLATEESLVNADRDAPPPAALASGSPPAAWLVVLALLAATAESLLYHRRKVG